MNKDGKFVDVGFNGEGHNSISYKIPKIYRTGYSSNKGGIGYLDPLWKDVTGEYPMPISDIALSGSDSDMKGDVLFLCIFNNKDWIPVAVSATENKKTMTFGNVARESRSATTRSPDIKMKVRASFIFRHPCETA